MTSHAHAPADASPTSLIRRRRALWISLVANAGFLVVQLIAGIAFGSLALVADSVHMASDVVAIGIALIAQQLAIRPASTRNTYGLLRAEVLGAQVNALLLACASAWVIYEAIHRFSSPTAVNGTGVIIVGTIGIFVNGLSAWLINRSAGESLNMRGAFWHLAADAIGSVGVVISGIVIVLTGKTWVDPAVSLLIAALVLWAAWRLLVDATRVLLEATPRGIDVVVVENLLRSDAAVDAVHHLHIWSIDSETPALSAHVVLRGEWTLHDAQDCGERLKTALADNFAIRHATLELECHACADDRTH